MFKFSATIVLISTGLECLYYAEVKTKVRIRIWLRLGLVHITRPFDGHHGHNLAIPFSIAGSNGPV